VMLTSLGARGDARRFQEIGFAAYATKPLRHQELKGILSLALAGQDGADPKPRPIATRYAGREQRNLFAGRKARILLAEDNITNQQVALGILKKLGLSAEAVANGAEAVKALETIPYDLVLMDVQMPQMDGYEATRLIRQSQSAVLNHQVPIIAMTAHAMQGDREKCLAAGMNDYITKPVTPQSLGDVLEKWLPKDPAAKRDQPSAKTKGHPPGKPDRPGSGRVERRKGETPVFDKAGMMSRLMDDEELALMVVEGFLDDIPQQIEALRGYLEAGDVHSAERQAHTMKGVSANVGGERLRDVASELEKAGKAGDLAVITTRLPELETQFAQLQEAMKDFINGKYRE
jgi:CheY-like chemotaxis protein